MSKNKTRTKDKYRVVYNDMQRIELENEFRLNEYIAIPRKQEIAHKLQLSERQIKIWFQNRRAKKRKQQKRKQLAASATSVTAPGQQQNRSSSDELTRSSASSLSVHQYGQHLHNHQQPQLIGNCSAAQLVTNYHDPHQNRGQHHQHHHQHHLLNPHQQQHMQQNSHRLNNDSSNENNNNSTFDLPFRQANSRTAAGSPSSSSSLYMCSTGNNNNNSDNNNQSNSEAGNCVSSADGSSNLPVIGQPVVVSNVSINQHRMDHVRNQLPQQQQTQLGSASSASTSPGSVSLKPSSPSAPLLTGSITTSPTITEYNPGARKWSPSAAKHELEKASPNPRQEQPLLACRQSRVYQHQQHQQHVAERLGQFTGNQPQPLNSASFYDQSTYSSDQVQNHQPDYYATIMNQHNQHNQHPLQSQQHHQAHHSQPDNVTSVFQQHHHNSQHQQQQVALTNVMVPQTEAAATTAQITAVNHQSGQVTELGNCWPQARSTAPNTVTPQLASGSTNAVVPSSTLSSSQSTSPAMLNSSNNHHHHHYHNQFHLGALPHLAATRAQQVAGLPMPSPYTSSGGHQGQDQASNYAPNGYHPHHHQQQHHNHHSHHHHQLMIEQHYANAVVDHAQSYIK